MSGNPSPLKILKMGTRSREGVPQQQYSEVRDTRSALERGLPDSITLKVEDFNEANAVIAMGWPMHPNARVASIPTLRVDMPTQVKEETKRFLGQLNKIGHAPLIDLIHVPVESANCENSAMVLVHLQTIDEHPHSQILIGIYYYHVRRKDDAIKSFLKSEEWTIFLRGLTKPAAPIPSTKEGTIVSSSELPLCEVS